MKYFIGYKQNEDTYMYVNNIGTIIGATLTYSNAIDFLSKENAINVCNFLNEYDEVHEYIVLEYKYSIKEVGE